MSIADDGLEAGKFYIFRWYAVNAFGSGELSNELTVALAAYPLASTQIRKVMSLSSITSISVEWNPVAPGASPAGDILGYRLTVKDTLNGTVWTAFDGKELNVRTQTKYTVRNLVPGRLYAFTVSAWNFNGEGQLSTEYEFLSCIVPEYFAAPVRTFTTKSQMGIKWTQPSVIGGCDLTSYVLFMKENGALESTIIEVNVDNDLQVRNRPGLNTFVITKFSASDLGKSFNIFLRAFTREGEHLDSDRATILLADVPDKPPTAPVMTQLYSSASQLHMTYPALADSLNGGSMILSYSLEWDGDASRPGVFVSLIGDRSDSLHTQLTLYSGVRKGQLYRFRYRARNIYGWSSYSDVATVLASQRPSKPMTPTFISATDA